MTRRAWAGAACVGAGLLYALSQVGFGLWPLVFVGFPLLWLTLEGRRPAAAAACGLAFGAAAYALGYGWLFGGIERLTAGDTALAAALWAANGLWFAAGLAAAAAATAALRARGWHEAVAGPVPVLLVEVLQPQLFAAPVGATLVHALPLVQLAELGGPLLLSWLVLSVGGLVLAAWNRWPGRAWAPPALGAVAALALAFGYGAIRIATLTPDAASDRLEIGVVQANLSTREKLTVPEEAQRRYLAQTRELLAAGPVDLVVWPETVYARGLRRPLPLDGEAIREGLDVPLLFGGVSVSEEGGRRVSANSAFLVGGDGRIASAYDKNQTIPFAETPRWLTAERAAAWFPTAQDFRPARELVPLVLGEVRIATPICYEIADARFVRAMVRATEAQLLVTLADDSWFGRSREPAIHLAVARLRAVEHRLWLVRSTNTGMSAFVAPSGHVTRSAALGAAENLRGGVAPRTAATPYTALGDALAWAAVAMAAILDRALRVRRAA